MSAEVDLWAMYNAGELEECNCCGDLFGAGHVVHFPALSGPWETQLCRECLLSGRELPL